MNYLFQLLLIFNEKEIFIILEKLRYLFKFIDLNIA